MSQTEQITSELKRLVGWGLDWRRAATLPVLGCLADATDMPYRKAGARVVDFITASIGSLEGPYEFHGRRIDTHRTRWALRLLLRLEGRHDDAPSRRFRAIRILELTGHTPEQWRRDPSPERDLLRLLACHMTKCRAETDELAEGLIRLLDAA